MAVPAWFDNNLYMKNKLAQMQETDSSYTMSKLNNEMNKAGFSGEEGHYNHFVKWGNAENVSPNAYFDPEYYFTSKAAQYFNVSINDVTTTQVNLMKEAFDRVGLSAWDHYLKYGMAEGIDPSASFSTSEYFNDKLALMQASDPTYTMDQLIAAFKAAKLNPVQHYFSWGQDEGLVPEHVSNAGSVQQVTAGKTDYVGMSISSFDEDTGAITIDDKFDDTFNAEVGGLQSETTIDGLGGNDLLYARVDATGKAGSLEPTVTNVETVLFRSQIGSGNSASTSAAVSAYIDADRITLADGENLTIGSDNSRANLAIEDVRHNSSETTVRFADADPAINFQLFFNPQNLTTEGAEQSGTLQLELIDVKNAQNNSQPLTEQPFNTFTFDYTVGSSVTSVKLDLSVVDASNYTGTTATYSTLLSAFQAAIAAYEATNPSMAGVFKASLGSNYHAEATVGAHTYTSDLGQYIVISGSGGTLNGLGTGNGWGVSTGTVPALGGIVWGINTGSTTTCPLIQTNVELDNVGRVQWDDASPECLPDDVIYGSNAGDLEIGSMAMRGGIERMDVYVDRGSWLSGLYSTNNTLRMVTVTARDINGDGTAEAGPLYIGDWDGKLDDEENGTSNLTWTDPAKLLTAGDTAGLHDVAVFNADGYAGDINIAAEITEDSYDKYLKSVDGVKGLSQLPPVAGYDNAFTYITGNGDDVVNMTVDGDIAADNDFAMNIVTGSGNDLVAFQYSSDITTNQSVNNKYMQKVNIDLGDGDDTAWFYGARVYDNNGEGVTVLKGGAVKISGGTGNDTIYANQVDWMTGGAGSGVTWGPDSYNAVFVLNAPSETPTTYGGNPREVGVNGLSGATLNNNIHTGSSTFTLTDSIGVTGATGFYVSVTFKGFASEDVLVGSYDASSTTALSYSAKQINDAIIKAVEEDSVLSGLLSAKDGSGHSLIIESLINGYMDADSDLSINFSLLNASKTVVKANVGVYGADGNAAWYEPQYGQKNGEDFTGNDSKVPSQVVVEAGAGNDLIVLGNNGETESNYGSVTVTFGDLTEARTGNTLTVTVGGKTYTSTYDGDTGDWSEFVTGEGDDQTKLSDDAKVTYDMTSIDAETGVLVFTKTDPHADDDKIPFADVAAASQVGAGTPATVEEIPGASTVAGNAYTATVTLPADITTDAEEGDTIIVTVGDGVYTSEYAAGAWGGFAETTAPTTGAVVGIAGVVPANGDVLDVTYTPGATGAGVALSDVPFSAVCSNETIGNPTLSEFAGETAQTVTFTVPDPDGTVTADDASDDLQEGNQLTVTVTDAEGNATVYTSTYDDADWGDFLDDENNVLNGVDLEEDPDDPTALVLTYTTNDGSAITAAASALGAPASEDANSEEEGNIYESNGRDIIELNGSFGNDYIVDFESGVDQINVHDLGLSSTTLRAGGTATTLDGNQAIVATVGKAEASTGIFTQSEVTKFVTDKAIDWTGTNYGSAVVLLTEDNAEEQNVYTAVLVSKASASASVTATVMGSLTLAAGEEIATQDLVGVSDLVDDPAYTAA